MKVSLSELILEQALGKGSFLCYDLHKVVQKHYRCYAL